ncbi:MAG: cysteine desulfurase [Proteobacteria bacterium]|nr:cysteine desulfurase [Pseudomonadota bacterium]
MSESFPVILGGFAPPGIGETAHSDLVTGLFREQLYRKSPPVTPDPGLSVPNADLVGHFQPIAEPSAYPDFGAFTTEEAPFSNERTTAATTAPVTELSLVNSEPQHEEGDLNPPPIHSLSPGATSGETEPKRIELPYGEPLGPRLDSPLRDGNASAREGYSLPFSGHSETPSYYFIEEPLPKASPEPKSGTPGASVHPAAPFDVERVRKDFPILSEKNSGKPLIFLDNAATTQKPRTVIDAISRFYEHDNSNIHRAAYELAERATEAFEGARDKVARFLGARSSKEIVFTRGTTESINLVANTFGRRFIGEGDEIILSQLEHHANIVPWQMLAKQVGAVIKVIPINDRGELILEEFVRLIGPRTKLVSVAHVSNSLGTINPVEEIIAIAHAHGVHVLVDGAQSTPHLPVNVQALDADFFVFSGHKVFGPTGIGALYAKSHLLEVLPPWQGGGHMIRDVTFERTIFQDAPEKFEAGTPDIAGAVGLGAAIDYLFSLGIPNIAAYEHSLLEYAMLRIAGVPSIRPLGTAANKASVLSFVIPGIPNETIASHLDKQGIAVRAGHHCALPAIRHFGLESSVRPSLAFYNTTHEIDTLVAALHDLVGRHRP